MLDKNSQEEDIKEMVMRVLNEREDWSKHLSHNCAKCQQCTCGKHKCKLTSVKMGLSPFTSTYQNAYQNKSIQKTVKPQKTVSSFEPENFICKSQYRKEYANKDSKPNKQKRQQIKAENNLKFGEGPSFFNTTYHNQFTPKSFSKRENMKNPQQLGLSGMRLNTGSSYRDTYKWTPQSVLNTPKPIKHKDNIKLEGSQLANKTVYNEDFSKNTPIKKKTQIDNFTPQRTYHSTKALKPKSSYQKDYSLKKNSQCPASYM